MKNNKKIDKKDKFVAKVLSVHGDKIDISKVNYIDSKTKVCLICHKKDKNGIEHGEYWQSPSNCVRGHICPKCANESRGKHGLLSMTTDKFRKEAITVHNGKYNLDKAKYVSAKEKVCIICPQHGEFWQLPYAHLRGQGCPQCTGKKMTLTNVLQKFSDVHGEQYDYSKVKFVKMKDKVCIVCKKHGEFWQTPQKHINGQGCPICAKEKRCGNIEENCVEFINAANRIHKSTYDYSKVKYVDNTTKVTIICPKHGEFLQRPNNHLQGCGCPKCSNNNSTAEDEIIALLRPLDCQKHNHSLLNGKEIDIFLPSLRLGIEYDGLRWHSEEFNKDSKYHVSKTDECEKNNVRLIHIFEDEWINKREIVSSRLLNIAGLTKEKIYARKCIVKEVKSTTAKEFLEKNHIQGYCNSLYRYGLYYNDELVSLMTFGRLRKNLGNVNREGCFELLRFCNKLNTTVIGGASKLFKNFLNEINPSYVISYADRRWSCGGLYKKLGFSFSHNSQPSYFYIINGKRKNRFGFRKDILVKEGFNKNMSEHEIMLSRHIFRIYDCGCSVYEWN